LSSASLTPVLIYFRPFLNDLQLDVVCLGKSEENVATMGKTILVTDSKYSDAE
jgi:hypothetical protein